MTTEYVAKIKGDISGLEKALKQAQGRLERLNDNEVIIKFDYDSNEQELNKIIKNLLSKNPELNVDIQYHLNKAALEQEKKKLSDMELSADPSKLIEEIQRVHKEYTNMFRSASDEELDKAEHYMAQLYATILNCADGFDLLEKLPKELQEQLEELAEVDPLKAFSEKEIQKQKEIINELEESIARLQEKASKVELTTTHDNFEDTKKDIDNTVVSLEKLLEKFSEYNKAHNYKNASAFWDEYKKKIEEGDEEAKELLKTLQLLNSNDSIDIVNDGAVKSGGIIGDDKVLLATRTNKNTDANKLQDTIELKKKLDEAADAGINVARILNVVSDAENKVFFEIQEKAKGNMLGSYENNWVNPDIFEATDEQIKKLILDLQKLNELGIGVDVNPTNIFYDKTKGFSFIDLDLNPATFKDQQDLIQDALSGITGEISVFYEELGDTAGISKIEVFENHIKELAQTLQGTATGAIKKTQDSASPSDEARDLGKDFGSGYALGIQDKIPDVEQAATELSGAALTALTKDNDNFWMAGIEHGRQYEKGLSEGIKSSFENSNDDNLAVYILQAIQDKLNRVSEYDPLYINKFFVDTEDLIIEIQNSLDKKAFSIKLDGAIGNIAQTLNTSAETVENSFMQAVKWFREANEWQRVNKEEIHERQLFANSKTGYVSNPTVVGDEHNVSKALSDLILKGSPNKKFDIDLHWHQDSDFAAPSGATGDLGYFFNHVFEEGIDKFMVGAQKEIAEFDFSKIAQNKSELEDLVEKQYSSIYQYIDHISDIYHRLWNDEYERLKDQTPPNYDHIQKNIDKIFNNRFPTELKSPLTGSISDLDDIYGWIFDNIEKDFNSYDKKMFFEDFYQQLRLNLYGGVIDTEDALKERIEDALNHADFGEDFKDIFPDITKALLNYFDTDVLKPDKKETDQIYQEAGSIAFKKISETDPILSKIITYYTNDEFDKKYGGLRQQASTQTVGNTETEIAPRLSDDFFYDLQTLINNTNPYYIEIVGQLADNFVEEIRKQIQSQIDNPSYSSLSAMDREQDADWWPSSVNEPDFVEEIEEDLEKTGDVAETEITTLLSLLEPLEKIKEAITEKNNLFLAEEEIVKNTTTSEFDHLGILFDMINEITQAVENLNKKFGDLSLGQFNELIQQFKGTKTNNKNVDSAVENLTKLIDKLNTLKIDDSGIVDSITKIVDASKQLKDAVEDAEKLKKTSGNADNKTQKQKKRSAKDIIADQLRYEKQRINLSNKEDLTPADEKSLTEIKFKLEDIGEEFAKIDFNEQEAKDALAEYNKEIQRYVQGIETYNSAQAKIDEANELTGKQNSLERLENKLNDILGKSGKFKDEFRAEIEKALNEDIDISNLDAVNDRIKKFNDLLSKSNNKDVLEGTFLKLQSYQTKISELLAKNTAMPKDLRSQFEALSGTIDGLIKQGKFANDAVIKIQQSFEELNTELNRSGKTGKSFFNQIGQRLTDMNAKYIAQFFSFHDILRYGRQIFSTIQELDTALVDLRKTTSMTAQELDEFYYESGKVAKEMGVTSTEIIQTAANWSRLGYSTKEAATEMAALSSQFAAISPGMDVEKATDGLVSSMKAFHVEVESVESDLMDPINRLGNTMATTNEEIVDMLERSSAAMAAANNSIDETLALESAAVQITRNAETTGTAFRTISMRIRGLDEETEELSEDLENISGDIADLTKSAAHPNGISLFTDKDKTTYKSTYQLLKDISEVYDELEDKQQAALLEKLAGKRGGQVLAGILGKENFKEVERAMGEITQAAGSADAEMEIIKDSVEYKLNALKNTWIDYAKELLNRDDIGKIIDALINASEKLEGTLDVLAPVIEKTINIIANLIEVIGNVVSVTGGATPVIIGFIAAFKKRDGLKEFKKDLLSIGNTIKKFGKLGKLITTPDLLNTVLNTKFDDSKGIFANISTALESALKEGAKNSTEAIAETLGDSTEAVKDVAGEVIGDSVVDDIKESTEILKDNIENEVKDIVDETGDFMEDMFMEQYNPDDNPMTELFEDVDKADDVVDQFSENIDSTNNNLNTAQKVIEEGTAVKEASIGADEANTKSTLEESVANEIEKDASLDSAVADEIEKDASLAAAGADAGEAAGSGVSGAANGMTIATKIGSKLKTVLSSLAAVWPLVAAGAAIGAAAFYKWYTSCEQVVKRTDKAIDKIFELRDTFQEEADNAKESAEKLEDLAEKYQNAVEGSSEYYDIANKIAELEPSLIIGWTSEGDAILTTTEKIQDQVQAYKNLAEAKRLALEEENKGIVNEYANGDNALGLYKRKVEETKADIEHYNEEIEKLSDPKNGAAYAQERYNNSADIQIKAFENLRKEATKDLEVYAQKAAELEGKVHSAYASLLPTKDDLSDTEKLLRDVVIDIGVSAQMDSDSFNDLYEQAEKAGKDIFDKLFKLQGNKELSTKEYQQQAEQIFNELVTALHLENDEEGKLALRVSLKIDPKSYADAKQEAVDWANKQGYNTKDAHYEGSEFIKPDEDAIEWYQSLNEEKQKIADSDEFTKELEKQKRKFGETRTACVEALKAVRAYGDATDEAGSKTLKSVLGEEGQEQLDDYYSTVSDIQEIINKINTGDYSAMDLNQWRVEYDLVGESAEEMVEELKGVEEESRKAIIELIDKFIKANPGETELIKSLQLIKKGIEDVRKEAEKKINFNPGLDKLDKFNDGLNSLQDSYIKFFKEGDLIDTDDLMGIREVFGELDEYQEFENAVLSGNGDLDASFDKLVTAYAKTTDVLSGLTEENQQYYITALKNKGIVNAEEVVTQKLTQDRQREAQRTKELEDLHASLADTNQDLVDKTKNLENATWQNIAALVAEGGQSGVTAQELALYALKKALAAGINLANKSDISYLLSLAKAAGVAAESITQLANAKAEIGTLESKLKTAQSKSGGRTTTEVQYLEEQIKNKSKEMKDLGNKIQDEVNNFEVEKYDINFDYNGTTAKDASGGGGSEPSPETFDWIETKIQRLERDITNLGKTADATYKTWAERTVALGQEMEKVNEQISLQETAYNAYMAKAESVGLSAQYKKLVQSGALKIDEITDETLKEQIQNYKEWYEKALDAKDKVEDLKSSLANLAKTKFDNIGAQFDDLISDIDHSLKYVTAQLESVETVGKIAGKSFYEEQIKSEQQRVNDLTAELGQLQTALTEGLASGAIAYGSQMFNEMKKSIYSVEESILDANNAILKFEQNIKQVAKANFDDLKSQFESAISILTDKIDLTDKIVNMVQATGHIASKAYYDALITGSDQNIQNLKKKYDELNKVFNDAVASGDVKEFSNEWYDMKSGIEAVKGEIIDATNSLIEYKNQLRQINWDLFDRGQTRLEQLISESQFLIDLYEKYPLFDKETGDITSKGMATRGLLVQNYETYIQQAALLADEIARLKEELKADPKNTTLIDRLRELEEAERSAILASEGVKESLRDLLENEINALLEALQKLIDQYKKNLQAQKDLHDFQKNIDQQNKNINALKKQLMAYDNGSDTTEENRARVQRLNDQLKQAEDQLKETEYDRYIQETQTLLDDFMQSLRDYFDEKLLDLNWVLERAIEDTNLNAETIRAQIEQTGVETGYVYTEEFTKIWENMTASDSLFSEQRDILASTSQVCTDIQAAVMELPTDQALASYLDGSTLQIVSEIANVDSAVGGVQSAIGETNAALAQIQSRIAEYNASVLSSIADAKAAAERANQAAQAAQATANAAKSGSGKEGTGGTTSPSSSTTTETKKQHGWSLSGMNGPFGTVYDTKAEADEAYNRLKNKKYISVIQLFKKGGRISDKDNPLDFLAQSLGEDHMVAAKEGERILTAKQNENFEKLANAFSSLSSEDMAKYSILTGSKVLGNMPQLQMPTLRSMESGNNTEINGGISINLPNVTNKAEFVEWLKTDGQIEKIVQSMTLGKLQGKNSYDKMKY